MSQEKQTVGQMELVGMLTALGNKIDTVDAKVTGMDQVMNLKMDTTNEHLRKLNSKVATNQSDIAKLKLSEAVRKAAEEERGKKRSFWYSVSSTVVAGVLLVIVLGVLALVPWGE